MTNKVVLSILKKLEKKYSFVTIERILQLRPFGILEKWKSGEEKIPPEGVALLRVINIHPDLFLRVADNKFENANEILVDEVLIKPEIKEQEKILNKGW